MKKIFSILLAGVMMFALAVCGNQMTAPDEEQKVSASKETETMSVKNVQNDQKESRSLVVYFSATGNTKEVAEILAQVQGADIFEIVPEQPYADEDLNYNNDDSRVAEEYNNPDARPEISGEIEKLESYDVIYIGYPLWWEDMPRIMNTFFDSYDFAGKTIAPFSTSASSKMSDSIETMKSLEPEAIILEGLRVSSSSASDAENEIREWLSSIGL